MTAKEKAQLLVDYFYGQTKHTLRDFKDAWDAAKNCAEICVDEIINSRPVLPSTAPQITLDRCCIAAKEYWEQVKEEINEL